MTNIKECPIGFSSIDMIHILNKVLLNIDEFKAGTTTDRKLKLLLLISDNTIGSMRLGPYWPKQIDGWDMLKELAELRGNAFRLYGNPVREEDALIYIRENDDLGNLDDLEIYVTEEDVSRIYITEALADSYTLNGLQQWHDLVPDSFSDFENPDKRMIKILIYLFNSSKYSQMLSDLFIASLDGYIADGHEVYQPLKDHLIHKRYEEFSQEIMAVVVAARMSKAQYKMIKEKNAPPEQKSITNKNRSNTDNNIVFCTVTELTTKYNLTEEDIAKQLLENDAQLYGFVTSQKSKNESGVKSNGNAGTLQQWADHIRSYSDCWGFLYYSAKEKKESRIIGNYSYCFLNDTLSTKMEKGDLTGDELTISNTIAPFGADEVSIHLMNLSVNESHKSSIALWNTLWTNFALSLCKWINSGVLINNIYASVFRKDFEPIFRNFGFEYLSDRKGSDNSYHKVWVNQLLNGFPAQFRKNMDNIIYPLEFQQLHYSDWEDGRLSDQNLKDIARLIFDSDPFIYKHMFASREHAVKTLPFVLASNTDNIFNLDNCYAAWSNDRIVGLILFHDGPINAWKSPNFKEHYDTFRPGNTSEETDGYYKRLEKVKDEYFKVYKSDYITNNGKLVENATSLILLAYSVHKSLRSNKIDHGYKLMNAFCNDEYKNKHLYLRVLPEVVKSDYDVYINAGFKYERQDTGFPEEEAIRCIIMVRPPQE